MLLLTGMTAAGLAGCLPAATREDVSRDWAQGWASWNSTDWGDIGRKLTGIDSLMLADNASPSADDRELCLNRNSEERVLAEEGVSDYVSYRRCPVSPYPTRSLGERLSPGHIDPIEY